jgi:hypothetical protein
MRTFLVAGAAGLAILSAATPAFASDKAGTDKPACEARYYEDLIGKDVSESRALGTANYRLLAAGSAAGQANPHRITVTYNAVNKRITGVACG